MLDSKRLVASAQTLCSAASKNVNFVSLGVVPSCIGVESPVIL